MVNHRVPKDDETERERERIMAQGGRGEGTYTLVFGPLSLTGSDNYPVYGRNMTLWSGV